jgi:hypothetical protein
LTTDEQSNAETADVQVDSTKVDVAALAEAASTEQAAATEVAATEAPAAEAAIEVEAAPDAKIPGGGFGSDSADVKEAKVKFAQMQEEMDAKIAAVENKRDLQEAAFKNQNSDDPAQQLQGLMTAQQSLKRMTSAFASKPISEKI